MKKLNDAKKDLISTALQAVAVCIVAPLLCALVGAFAGSSSANSALLNMFGEIPVFKAVTELMDVLLQMRVFESSNDPDAYLIPIAAVLDALDGTIFELLDVTLGIEICKIVWGALRKSKKVYGAPILASVLGVSIGYLAVGLFEIPIVVSLCLLLLLIVLDMIFVQDIKIGFATMVVRYILSTLKFSVDMLYSLWLTGAVALLLLISQGDIANMPVKMILIGCTILPLMFMGFMKVITFKK